VVDFLQKKSLFICSIKDRIIIQPLSVDTRRGLCVLASCRYTSRRPNDDMCKCEHWLVLVK